MARPIDAYTLNNDLVSWYNDTEDEKEKSILRRVMQRVVQAPTLTPPNEWVNRARELDELYTKLQIITGFTVEQLIEIFAAGYTLEKPDYSKSFEEIASLAETTPPNEPLTCEGCYYIKNDDYSPCAWCIRSKENEDYYRCPPEGEVDT